MRNFKSADIFFSYAVTLFKNFTKEHATTKL